MELLVVFLIFGGFVTLFLGGLYQLIRRERQKIKQQFAEYSQSAGFSLMAQEDHSALRDVLTTMPGWQNKNVIVRVAACKEEADIKAYLIICEQAGYRVSFQFAVALFSSPILQLPSFHLRPKHSNEKQEIWESLPLFSQNFVVEYTNKAQVIAHFTNHAAQHYTDWLTTNGWSPRLRLAGLGNHFICFCLTKGLPDKETIGLLAREGWQHMLAHQTAQKQGDVR